MANVKLNTPAPDFTLVDHNGVPFKLSDFQGKSNVYLVFNRGIF